MTNASVITPDHLAASQSYEEYQRMIVALLADGKTTGDNHSEEMIHYTELNQQRMHRLDKVAQLTDALQKKLTSISTPGRGWCSPKRGAVMRRKLSP